LQLVNELIHEYGLDVIEAYMNHIQSNAEIAVREMLKSFGTRFKQRTLKTSVNAVDYLDDGSPIKLRIEFNLKKGEAIFDFRYVP
jgi:5-oxoprolinase (ATP-hydrolysing)